MSKTAQEAIAEITEFVQNMGDAYGDWYAGIAQDPMERLYAGHRVPRHTKFVKAVPTHSANEARKAEKALLALGFDGGDGGGDNSSSWVYAYKKSGSTIP